MLGRKLKDLGSLTGGQIEGVLAVRKVCVKSPVLPFGKFPGVDPALGPEMRSTGEVMGVGDNFGEAFDKAQRSAGAPLPKSGARVFQRQRPPQAGGRSRSPGGSPAMGFELAATRGTASVLQIGRAQGADRLQGERGPAQRGGPDEGLGALQLAIYTTTGAHTFEDERSIRRNAGP